MATKKTKDHPSGVDRWTSNGKGVKLGAQTPQQKAQIAELNKELSAAKKAGKKPAKK